jgi:hypothetical protein
MKKENAAKSENVAPALPGKERVNVQGKFLRSPPIRQMMKPFVRPLWV